MAFFFLMPLPSNADLKELVKPIEIFLRDAVWLE